MHTLLDIFLHIDKHLEGLVASYGVLTYGILFLVVFCETGLVVTPFLPGDSLLFAAGALAVFGDGSFSIWILWPLLVAAAILGDSLNYAIGRRLGARVKEKGRLLGLPVKKEHLDRTGRFFEKYGARAIVIARFMPIVRTFAPFVAGVGHMTYRTFIVYNVVGAIAWVSLFTFAGYFFGNIPFVKANFEYVIVAIIVLSCLPPLFEFLKARRESASERSTAASLAAASNAAAAADEPAPKQ